MKRYATLLLLVIGFGLSACVEDSSSPGVVEPVSSSNAAQYGESKLEDAGP